VLTAAKLGAGKVTLDAAKIPLSQTMANVQEYVEQLNRDSKLDVAWEMDEDLPSLLTDHVKLEEILRNLIGNAYKFTDRGTIDIQIHNIKDEKRVEFTIADTGIGIPEPDLDQVFDQFHQTEGAHKGAVDGIGLGLSIVRKYLELMQGEIRVESKVGVGAKFSFTLPYAVECSV